MSLFPTGKIQTVTGPVNPDQLGKTLVHEHLSMTFDVAYVEPAKPEELLKTNMPFEMENLGWIRYNPYSHRPNLKLNDVECEEAILKEIARYRAAGGGCIVECTTHGIERKAQFLRQVSEKTGVHIVAGTGYYIAASHDANLFHEPIEKLMEIMRSEITTGCNEAPDIRCGFIGEIGCSWPLHSFEKKVLQAAALVQAEAKCPVSIHPGRSPQSPSEVLRVFQEAGGDANKVALCHLDRTLVKENDLLDFAQMGSFLEFDLFGVECSYYQLNEKFSMPSDAQRIDTLVRLVDQGYENKIVVSHDIHTKHRLEKFGGHGYSHILDNIIPRMANKGLSSAVIDKILISNPASWLTFG